MEKALKEIDWRIDMHWRWLVRVSGVRAAACRRVLTWRGCPAQYRDPRSPPETIEMIRLWAAPVTPDEEVWRREDLAKLMRRKVRCLSRLCAGVSDAVFS